ncbi:dihydrofolate reductase family protein [Kineococcus sp. NUM-3379]
MGITVVASVTLDGVAQAPGRAEEDTRGGFALGGWAAPYADAVQARAMGAGMARAAAGEAALLFGRRTYEDFAGFWPRQRDNPFTPVLEAARKVVVSRTLEGPLPWANSEVLRGEATGTLPRLLADGDVDLTLLGSTTLSRSLLAAGLVDGLTLLVHPLVLGTGSRLLDGGLPRAAWENVETVVTGTGVVIATYRPVRDGQRTDPRTDLRTEEDEA